MFGITIFGDSITFGRGNNLNRGWCGRLQKYFETKDYYNCLYNLGLCGDTTTNVLERFASEAKARVKFKRNGDRQVIIFAIGINDSRLLGKDKTPETKTNIFKKNIKTLITRAKKFTPEIIFIGLTPVDESITLNYEDTIFTNERIKEFNDIVKSICSENEIPFLDILPKMSKLNYSKLLDDGLHPNSKGYLVMYKIIKKFLIQNKIID